MSVPEIVKCPDGHFRRAMYGLGPYIADYPEQVWLSGIVQGWCPKCAFILESINRDANSNIKCSGALRLLTISIAKGAAQGARQKRSSLPGHGNQAHSGPILASVQILWYVHMLLFPSVKLKGVNSHSLMVSPELISTN
jgi:Plavaka transposase